MRMTHGTVVTFSSSSGFGYITVDGSRARLFVDFTAATDATVLRPGQRVTFRIAPGAMGRHAVHVHAAPPVPAALY